MLKFTFSASVFHRLVFNEFGHLRFYFHFSKRTRNNELNQFHIDCVYFDVQQMLYSFHFSIQSIVPLSDAASAVSYDDIKIIFHKNSIHQTRATHLMLPLDAAFSQFYPLFQIDILTNFLYAFFMLFFRFGFTFFPHLFAMSTNNKCYNNLTDSPVEFRFIWICIFR